jgi:hypothetical protein
VIGNARNEGSIGQHVLGISTMNGEAVRALDLTERLVPAQTLRAALARIVDPGHPNHLTLERGIHP